MNELTIVFSVTDFKTESRCTSIVSGQDANGGDMNVVYPARVLTAASCAALCEVYPDCDHWSFNKDSGKCFVKNKPSQMRADASSYSGNCTKST